MHWFLKKKSKKLLALTNNRTIKVKALMMNERADWAFQKASPQNKRPNTSAWLGHLSHSDYLLQEWAVLRISPIQALYYKNGLFCISLPFRLFITRMGCFAYLSHSDSLLPEWAAARRNFWHTYNSQSWKNRRRKKLFVPKRKINRKKKNQVSAVGFFAKKNAVKKRPISHRLGLAWGAGKDRVSCFFQKSTNYNLDQTCNSLFCSLKIHWSTNFM